MQRAALAITVLVLTFGAGCAPTDATDVHTLDTGTITYPGQPPAPVELPDYWIPARRAAHREGTYTLPLELSHDVTSLWAVYLPRLSMNAAVLVNGHFLGDGGRMTPPLSRNANRPLIFRIPSGLLHAGRNEVKVRLANEVTFPALIDPVEIGPDAVLGRRFEVRYALQVLVPQGMAATSCAIALLTLGIFVRRDERGATGWFAAALLLWSLSLVTGFLRDPPLASRPWEFVGGASLAGVVYCLTRAFHLRMTGQRQLWRERVAGLILTAPGMALAVVPASEAFRAWLGWQVATGAVAAYVFVLIFQSTRRGLIAHPRPLAILASIGGFFVLHDLVSVVWGQPITGFWLSGYAASVALLFAAWSIIANLADSLNESETLNRELEGRVQEKHQELEENYRQIRSYERERAIAAERERIMQDVHDGIGGQLVSTLALVESGRDAPGVVADSLHEALDDLRLIIDSLDPEEGDLAAALGTMRLRLQPRLERHGITIDWRVRDVPAIEGFGPEQALQVLRVVQEAVANVLKHAGASRVTVSTGSLPPEAPSVAYVEILDDGQGFERDAPRGRGLANMQRRAATLGGILEIDTVGGTRVRLQIPLNRRASEAR